MAEFFIRSDGSLMAAGLVPGSLEDAIAKWEFIAEHVDEIKSGYEANTCALCLAYLFGDNGGCEGCPVAEAVGEGFCFGTPYVEFSVALDEDRLDDTQKAALAEAAFLRSLLGGA